MSLHEIKYCPSCVQKFECKVGSIYLCQCSTIKLSEKEKNYVENKYSDCLCINCLQKIKVQLSNGKN